jgi:hypothetical protein
MNVNKEVMDVELKGQQRFSKRSGKTHKKKSEETALEIPSMIRSN